MMVELQSCVGLGANASTLCAIEQEVKGDNAMIITEISAELQKERQKNAELVKRILALEAQINERNEEAMLSNGQADCKHSRGRCIRKFKRRKIDKKIKRDSGSESLHKKDVYDQDRLVNWMGIEDTPLLHFERLKDSDSAMDDGSDGEDSNPFEEDVNQADGKDGVDSLNPGCAKEVDEQFLKDGVFHEKDTCLIGVSDGHSEAKHAQQTTKDLKEKILMPDKSFVYNAGELNTQYKGPEVIGRCNQLSDVLSSLQEVKDNGNNIPQKKLPKMAFCPKEVKRILESGALLQKNAQAHTIRKIIVFASLGIRHGCDDMYELDFSHFSILQKGEPYVSPQNPGEHVLYEYPGVRRKIFYPNCQNPTLCPVQVLEEERAMRPSDDSCPSCLFLCIKYGGRTRNLPQNEYVRQRMGRNKLKSFGPVICQMAMLVHVRSGSFFFKALGITLLFMAGFPDALVQRETKYRNLDLLQKYYRRDEDAEGEELFLSHPLTKDDDTSPKSNKRIGKTIPRESKRRKQTSLTRRSPKQSSNAESTPGSSIPLKQFKLMGCDSTQICAMTSLQFAPSQPTGDTLSIPSTMVTASGANISYHSQSSCPVFPPQRMNSFVPMVYWPPLNAISTCSYTSSYSYRYPAAGNYIPIYPQPYYSHPSFFSPNNQLPKETAHSDAVPADLDSESNSSSSSTEPKEE